MKKFILLVLSLLPVIFIFTGCSDSSEPFTRKNYDTDGEQVDEIIVDVRDRQVEVEISDDAQIHIEYFDNDKEFFDIAVSENRVLTMKLANNKEWTDYIGGKPSASERKIVLQIPSNLLTSLSISTTNENISMPSLNLKSEVSLTTNGGDITFEALDVGKSIILSTKNGDIRGKIQGGYDDFSIDCAVKKGECNLPSHKEGGDKKLSVTVNNGNAEIEL